MSSSVRSLNKSRGSIASSTKSAVSGGTSSGSAAAWGSVAPPAPQLSSSSMAALLLEAFKATEQPLSLFAKKLSILVSRGAAVKNGDDALSFSYLTTVRQRQLQLSAIGASDTSASSTEDGLPHLLGSLICFLTTNGLLNRLQTLMGVWILCSKFGGGRGAFGLDLLAFLGPDGGRSSTFSLLAVDITLSLEWLNGGLALEKCSSMSIENVVAQLSPDGSAVADPGWRESIVTSPRAAQPQITLIPALNTTQGSVIVDSSFLETVIDELRPPGSPTEGPQAFELQHMADCFASLIPPIFEWGRVLPSPETHMSHPRLSADLYWLGAAPLGDSPFMFDNTLVDDMSASLLRRSLSRASRETMSPEEVIHIISKIESCHISEEEFAAENISAIYSYNPSVVLSFYKCFFTRHPELQHEIDHGKHRQPSVRPLDAVRNLPLTVASIELIHRLMAETSLPSHVVISFVINSVQTVESTSDKYLQARLVRLVSVFITALVRNKTIPTGSDLAQNILPAFCKAFSKIKEVAVLSKMLK